MSNLLKLEEALMLGLGIFLFGGLGYEWWWFPLLLLLPDIGMLGYLFGNVAGAVGYNLFHHKGLAIALFFWDRFFPYLYANCAGPYCFPMPPLIGCWGTVSSMEKDLSIPIWE